MDYGSGVDCNFKGYGAGGDYQLKDIELAVITCIKAMELVVII